MKDIKQALAFYLKYKDKVNTIENKYNEITNYLKIDEMNNLMDLCYSLNYLEDLVYNYKQNIVTLKANDLTTFGSLDDSYFEELEELSKYNTLIIDVIENYIVLNKKLKIISEKLKL